MVVIGVGQVHPLDVAASVTPIVRKHGSFSTTTGIEEEDALHHLLPRDPKCSVSKVNLLQGVIRERIGVSIRSHLFCPKKHLVK